MSADDDRAIQIMRAYAKGRHKSGDFTAKLISAREIREFCARYDGSLPVQGTGTMLHDQSAWEALVREVAEHVTAGEPPADPDHVAPPMPGEVVA